VYTLDVNGDVNEMALVPTVHSAVVIAISPAVAFSVFNADFPGAFQVGYMEDNG